MTRGKVYFDRLSLYRVNDYWAGLMKLNELDRYAIRCGHHPASIEYAIAKRELRRRREVKEKMYVTKRTYRKLLAAAS